MGCDIHTFIEVRDSKTGEWIFRPMASEVFTWRSYLMFSVLADVRNDGSIKPISVAKGVPSDVSEKIKRRIGNIYEEGHSHSWLLLKELIDYDYNAELRERLGDCFFKDLAIMSTLGEPDNVRIVFFFDS